MLKSLQIKNFKGWKDTGKIRMAPITLFFGVNSSGKSSIGQFLMMLKQTVESSDRKAVLHPGNKKSAVQLGSYREMVFHRNPENSISFNYEWELDDALLITDSISGNKYRGDKIAFSGNVRLDSKDLRTVYVDNFNYQLSDEEQDEFAIGLKKLNSNQKSEYEITSRNFSLVRQKGRPWPIKEPYQFYGFSDEAVAYYQNTSFLKEFNLQHEKFFNSIFYLGPLRTKTDRIYSWQGFEPESVGYSGEGTIAAILAAKNRKIGLVKPGKHRASPLKPFEEILASQLKEMDLIKGFKVIEVSKVRQEYLVNIQTKGSKDWVDLPDVGFGISQVLPVLTQMFYAPANSIIIIEQPEIHLHPSAQSALADVIINAAKAKENNINRNVQFIIESHSEHFLRRLQRRIAEEVIPEDMVSAYFADITKSPAVLEPLKIDEYGNIRNWPDNFFGDEMGDILKHSKAAMQKRMRQLEEEKTSE